MQPGSKRAFAGKPTQIADLRQDWRKAQKPREPKISEPPPPRKGPRRESEEDRAIKAEKLAVAQHTTSLLNGGKPAGRNYRRPGERRERRTSVIGTLLQVIVVFGIVGGVAYAVDPTLVPPEWVDTARGFISQYVKI